MSFWGVEVKPGKPFTHYFDRTVGRLRVSQATLGIGSRTARSLVQCNVGNKSPVFLCALLPNKIESCHLDLEFEEADDVVFSVLGPRSVHLSGYYVSKSSSANRNSDTESYGEDIANTDTEASDLGSENDDYGGSFIDDDDDDDDDDGKEVEVEDEEGEPNVFLSSPISRNGNAGNKKGNHKGLKKKNRQAVEPADNINSEERGDEMNSTMAVLRHKKSANKCNVIESEDDNNEQESKGDKSYLLTAFGNEIPECGETADKVTGDVAAPSQSGGRDEDHRGEDDVPVEVTNMSNSCKDCPEPDARSTKTSDDAKDQAVGMSILENVYADDNTEQFTDHDISQALKGTKDAQSAVSDMNIGNLSVSLDHLADVQVENRQKLKRKKDLEGDRLGECNGSGPGDAGEELKQVVENDDHYTSLDLSACEQAENGPKLKKQKKGSREGEWDDCQASSHVDGVVELKQDVKTTDRGNESLPTTEATQVLTTIQSIGINSDEGSQPDKKNKKKKKKSKVEDDGTGSMLEKDGDYSIPDVTVGEAKQMVEATAMDKDLPATTDKNKDPTTQSIDVISNVANGSQPEKKRDKKKNKKTKVAKDGASSVIDQDKCVDQCKNISNDDVVEQIKQIIEAVEMDTSLLPTTKQHESLTTRINDVTSDVADGFQSVKKHSNKKAKVGDDGMSSVPEADSTMNGVLPPSPNDKGTDPESGQSRSFSNGLIVEDLAKGNPDGRVATTGRKVKVHFTGMLWENGHTFTPSGATFRFCLGDKGVLPGWNIGIEGMRVGDKRRLTIPPLLGYGSEGFGEQIPPNSWLVYDIELVSVHR